MNPLREDQWITDYDETSNVMPIGYKPVAVPRHTYPFNKWGRELFEAPAGPGPSTTQMPYVTTTMETFSLTQKLVTPCTTMNPSPYGAPENPAYGPLPGRTPG